MGHTVCMKTNTSRGTYMGRRLDVVCKWGGRVCGKNRCVHVCFFQLVLNPSPYCGEKTSMLPKNLIKFLLKYKDTDKNTLDDLRSER